MANLFRCCGGNTEQKVQPLYVVKNGVLSSDYTSHDQTVFANSYYKSGFNYDGRVTTIYQQLGEQNFCGLHYGQFDVTKYDKLVLECTVGSRAITVTLDTSVISGKYYLFITTWRDSGKSYTTPNIYLCTDASNPWATSIIVKTIEKTTNYMSDYVTINNLWFGNNVTKYLYKDGNVQEQIVPLYTDGVQNVELEQIPLLQAFDTVYNIRFDASTIKINTPDADRICCGVQTAEKINLDGISKIVSISSANNTQYTTVLDVSNLSGSFYIRDVANRYATKVDHVLAIVNEKNDGSSFKFSMINDLNRADRYISKIYLVKSVAKATDKNAVDWDNSGYLVNSALSLVNDGGAIINDANMQLNIPSTVNHSVSVISDKPIDISEYSTLKVLTTLVSGGAQNVDSVDISALSGSAYITLCALYNSSGYYMMWGVSSSKNNFNGTKLADVSKNRGSCYVNRVWLEN